MRQTSVSEQTLNLYCRELKDYPLAVIEATCLRIGRTPRAEGELAFPELGRLLQFCKDERTEMARQTMRADEADAERLQKLADAEHRRRYETDSVYKAACDASRDAFLLAWRTVAGVKSIDQGRKRAAVLPPPDVLPTRCAHEGWTAQDHRRHADYLDRCAQAKSDREEMAAL
jgi:hypothetical protein